MVLYLIPIYALQDFEFCNFLLTSSFPYAKTFYPMFVRSMTEGISFALFTALHVISGAEPATLRFNNYMSN